MYKVRTKTFNLDANEILSVNKVLTKRDLRVIHFHKQPSGRKFIELFESRSELLLEP